MMPSNDAAASHDHEPSAQRATFIVRVWRERLDDAHAEWRGTIEHVQSGERRAVVDADGAARLVASWLSALAEQPASETIAGR
jgi:hypothetical protein